jgi:hypothetical protein
VQQLETAIAFFELDIRLPWILRRLEALRIQESTLVLAQQGTKRERGADQSAESSVDDEPVVKAARGKKAKRAGTKPVALAVTRAAASRTVVAVPQPPAARASNARSRFGGICKSNCSLEGCARVPCRFEHVKGARVLTAAEKAHVKAMIALHNTNVPTTGFPMLTADPVVVD